LLLVCRVANASSRAPRMHSRTTGPHVFLLSHRQSGVTDRSGLQTGGRTGRRDESRAMHNQEEQSQASNPTAPGEAPHVAGSSGRGAASPGRGGGVMQACGRCGITPDNLKGGRLLDCGACLNMRYCGKACQTADWKAHKAACKAHQALQGNT
jgi:hypothetical protein